MSRLEESQERIEREAPYEALARTIETGWQSVREQTAVWPSSLNWVLRLLEWLAANQAALVTAAVIVTTMRISLAAVGLLAKAFIPENRLPLAIHLTSNPLVDMWVRWDAVHYLQIASYGYQPKTDNLAFFPVLPILMRAVGHFLDNDLMLAGLVVSTLSFAAALVYLYKLVEMDFDKETAGRTVLYLALAPMSFFFLSIYTEPLFLLFSVGSIYHARRNQWWAASIMGALAVLNRPVGILLLVPLGYLALKVWWANKRNILPALTLGLLPAALLGWMAYLYNLTGDALAFVHAQSGSTWHRVSDTPWNTMIEAFRRLSLSVGQPYNHMQYTVDMVSTLVLLVAAVIAFVYLPRVYSFYLAASVLMLLMSHSDLQVLFSMPRFAMVEFPLFILLAMAGRNQHVHRFITFFAPILLGLYAAMFVQWYWIA